MDQDKLSRGRHYRGQQPKRFRKAQAPDAKCFAWVTDEMLNNPAWACLNADEHRCLWRIWKEHLAHNRTENGLLIVTYDDFEKFGVRRNNIRAALVGLRVLGFIKFTDGRGGRGAGAMCNRYRLTCCGDEDGRRSKDWTRHKLRDGETLSAFRTAIRQRIGDAIATDKVSLPGSKSRVGHPRRGFDESKIKARREAENV